MQLGWKGIENLRPNIKSGIKNAYCPIPAHISATIKIEF
jgi:hypothetical protein